MVRSAFANRGPAHSKRVKSSSRRSSTTKHHKSEDLKQAAAIQPDVAEVRRFRQTYYSQPARTTIRSSTNGTESSPRSRPARSQSSRSKNKDILAEISSKEITGKRPDRTEEYVDRTILEEEEDEQTRPQSREQCKIRGNSCLLDVEVTPDDSVSVVATRRHRSRRTMRSTLRPSVEKPREVASPVSRRNFFFGSILSRRTSTVSAAPQVIECLTCGADNIPATKSAKLECNHRMCHSCLKRIFKLSVQDPAHMPPKCCTEHTIPLKHVEKLFDLKFKLLYNKKLDEYRMKDRIYCPNRRCGTWIRPAYYHTSRGRRFAQCNKCKTKACLACGLQLHRTSECPQDPDMARLVEQAEREGWKRCYSCNAMVELKEGCNHMTCRCTAQFCMVCGSKWKTCDCPWFNNVAALPINDPFLVIDFVRRPILGEPPRPETYAQELQQRRRQEREDEELAREMQFATLWDDPLRNAGNPFMNDDFRRENSFAPDHGDDVMGRRRARSAAKRRAGR